MICCEIDRKSKNIGASSFSIDMYRNLPSDTSQASAENNYFQPGYNSRTNPTQSYASSSYNVAQPTFTSSGDHVHQGSSLGHEYSSQFFVSELNTHFHGESSSSHCNWSHAGAFYPGDALPPVLNPCSSWDPTTHSLHGHSGGLGSTSASGFSGTNPAAQSSLMEGSETSSLPPVSLTAVDCFSTGSDGTSSVALHLPALQHRTLPAQRRPFEWINKNAYQNPQTQQGKTRTKDKYRVVYSDHQRLELEKEFRFSRYITIRRKAELAAQLCLSERQVKIWFQNRRAKERKASKKNTNMNTASGEDQEGFEDGDASDNSGQGNDSSPGMTSLSADQLSPNQSQILAFNHSSHASSGIVSPIPAPHGGASHAAVPYPYANSVESPPETDNFGALPELDIKPLLTGTNEPHRVTSSHDDARAGKMDTSPPMHKNLDEL